MAVPNDINSTAFQPLANVAIGYANPRVTTGPRAQLQKNFFPYLELTMQSKHDGFLRGYCQSIRVTGRAQDGNQVGHGLTTAPAVWTFYAGLSAVICDRVIQHMIARWRSAPTGGNVSIQTGQVFLAQQKIIQSNGYRYEASYYYQPEGIYVPFHCYPA
jgi:hypothetical protein